MLNSGHKYIIYYINLRKVFKNTVPVHERIWRNSSL